MSEASESSVPGALSEEEEEVEQPQRPTTGTSRKRSRTPEGHADSAKDEERHDDPQAAGTPDESTRDASSSTPTAPADSRCVTPLRSAPPAKVKRARRAATVWGLTAHVDVSSDE
jgi:hypothetical protein